MTADIVQNGIFLNVSISQKKEIQQTSNCNLILYAGADPGFKAMGGALKKLSPSGARRENVWSISCEKSRFSAKNHIFSKF